MSSVDDREDSEPWSNADESSQSSRGGLAAWTDAVQEMSPYLDLGWRLAASAAGTPLLGHFCVDLWFGTTPWGLIGGAVLGFVAAGVQLKQLQREFGA